MRFLNNNKKKTHAISANPSFTENIWTFVNFLLDSNGFVYFRLGVVLRGVLERAMCTTQGEGADTGSAGAAAAWWQVGDINRGTTVKPSFQDLIRVLLLIFFFAATKVETPEPCVMHTFCSCCNDIDGKAHFAHLAKHSHQVTMPAPVPAAHRTAPEPMLVSMSGARWSISRSAPVPKPEQTLAARLVEP